MLRPNRPVSLHPAALFAAARRAWRRSLQVRVVTITLVTSGALVATFAILVSARITDGLISAKTESAVESARTDSADVKGQLDAITDARDVAARTNVEVVRSTSASRVGAPVQIVPADAQARLLELPAVATVPDEFAAAVSTAGMAQQRLNLDLDRSGEERLYLVVGRVLEQQWGTLHIYYFFPLDNEATLAGEFTNTITVTGLALVLMLALVAYLVTRMVVSPVRVAARTAQRLSNGLLDQRMEVNGEDDLAALAASFNQMAENLQRHILRLEEMSRLQRRFTSDVSHELRTPLTTVRMAADLIYSEREEFDAPVSRSAELLVAELDRFESLLAELLEISRFDAGFAALDAEPANLGPMLERVIDRLSPVAERAGVTVELDLPTEPVVA